jgi:uncharacterized protein DUF748
MRRVFKWLFAGLTVLLVLLFVFVRFFLDEHLRRTIEHNANARLDGYTIRIGQLRFHPIGFSLDLIDSYVVQDAYPEPPVAYLPLLHASVQWSALFDGRLVADFLLDRPKLNINLKQAKKEVDDKVPISERGWQDTLEEIYPLKVNLFRIQDAEIAYTDRGPFKPLTLRQVNFEAENIRNVHSKERVYPSEVHLDAAVFANGKIVFDGNADFLAEPHPGIKGEVSLERIELDYLQPITSRYNFSIHNGVFSTDGTVEYAPKKKVVDLEHITVQGVGVDFVHKPATAAAEQQMGRQVAQAAKEVSNEPDVLLRVEEINLLNSRLAFINKAASPEYEIFFTESQLKLENLSNQGSEGMALGAFRGKFMGTGETVVKAVFQPKAKSADFDVKLLVEGTDLTTLNNLLLASANFDVNEGRFSLYSELTVREGRVNGYIKPLFKNLDVYDADKDANKTFGQKLRQGLVGALAWLFSNKSRDEVATTITFTGSIDSPQYSTWEAFTGVLKNAFIRAIVPGFEGSDRMKPAPEKETGQQVSPAGPPQR